MITLTFHFYSKNNDLGYSTISKEAFNFDDLSDAQNISNKNELAQLKYPFLLVFRHGLKHLDGDLIVQFK